MTDDWMLPKVSDYWDDGVRAIDTAARRLSSLSESDRIANLKAIAAAVTEHVRVLPNKLLALAAVPFFDDLYRAASGSDRWDDSLADYLTASAGTLSRLLIDRGLRIQYLVDNAWDDMQKPIELLPNWYRAAGVVFACPQVVALALIKADHADGHPDPSDLVPRYIREARDVAHEIVVQCAQESRHLFLLDTDSVEDSFRVAQGFLRSPGVISILRNETPFAGTNVTTWFPPQLEIAE